jgi:hypothetical protein
MMDYRVKAKELLEEFEKINSGNTKLKLELQKKLEKLSQFSDKKYFETIANDVSKVLKNADLIVRAIDFIENNGAFSFDGELMGTPKGDYISVFLKHQDSFSDEEYWEKLAYVYIMQDFAHVPYEVYKNIFSSNRSNREKLMNDEDIKFLDNLPETITIYRGGAVNEKRTGFGISWTLSKDIAQQFVDRKKVLSNDQMEVLELTIKKSKVVAYFSERNEEEIIYLGE